MHRRMVVAALGLAFPAAAWGQFVDVSASHGISGYMMASGMAGGVAAADYDGDGDIDLFMPCAEGIADKLWVNDGTGHYTDIAPFVGLGSMENGRGSLFFDYDGDGDLDLLVAHDCINLTCPPTTNLRLYRQDAGFFTDTSVESGLFGVLENAPDIHMGGMAAGDLDNDDDLDLFVGFWNGAAYIYRNNGDNTFTDVSVASGTRDPGQASPFHWQPIIHDFNRDGWMDIFCAIDFSENRLYINQQDGTFVDVAPAAGCDNAWNDMGVTIIDMDDDGDFDFYITNVWNFTGVGEHNVLYESRVSEGLLQFNEVAAARGVDNTDWGWGCTFFDVENDGDVDLAATNGFNGIPWSADSSRMFCNDGSPSFTFVNLSNEWDFKDKDRGSGLVSFDMDRDGDLDMAQVCAAGGPARLLENTGIASEPTGNWLAVRPRMDTMNTHAIGAIVRVTVDGRTMSRLITAGCSTLSQEPAEAHFGLAGADRIVKLVVEWPDGTKTTRWDVEANQVLELRPSTRPDPGLSTPSKFPK